VSKKAVIDCDYGSCDKRETFPPDRPPPRTWYLVTHPAVRGPAPVRDVSTFCSPEHLALWAKERGDHVG
jgi:hypothetical protein